MNYEKRNVTNTTYTRFARIVGRNGRYCALALDDISADRILPEKEKEFFDMVYGVVFTDDEYSKLFEIYARPRKKRELSDAVLIERYKKEKEKLEQKYAKLLNKE